MPRLETTGLSVDTQSRLSDVPIPEELWAPSLAAAREIAASVGIDRLVVQVDLPGRHVVQLVSDDGRLVRIGSFKAASLTTDTGCRLREAELGGAQ